MSLECTYIFEISQYTPIFPRVNCNLNLNLQSKNGHFRLFDDNMQMRLKASLKPKYSKVFKFKGFHIKRRPPKGGGWALGPCWAESNSILTQGMRHVN